MPGKWKSERRGNGYRRLASAVILRAIKEGDVEFFSGDMYPWIAVLGMDVGRVREKVRGVLRE